MNQILDIRRVLMYSKLKVDLNKKMFLIGLLGYFGFVFIVTFFIAVNITQGQEFILNNFHIGAYIFMLFGGGVFITGRSFHAMNTPEKSISQILIPVSNFEKYIVPLFSTTIGWVLLSFLSYEVFALLVNGLWSAVFDLSTGFLNMFESFPGQKIVEVFKGYILIHSIFFLGAATFKKYPIAKTALSVFIFNSITTFISLFLILILFGSFMDFGMASKSFFELYLENLDYSQELILKLKNIGEAVFIIVIPLILYSAAFYKLKEREV